MAQPTMYFLLFVYTMSERCSTLAMASCTLPANALSRSETDKLTFETIVRSNLIQHEIICNLEVLHPQYRAVGNDFVLLLIDHNDMGLKSKVNRYLNKFKKFAKEFE